MSEVPPIDRQLIIPTTTSRWHCFLVNTCEQVHTILSLYYLGARCWERLRAGGEGEDRGWDGWMASPTRWTWVWASSGNWRWTRKPGVLLFTGSQSPTRLSDWIELSMVEVRLKIVLKSSMKGRGTTKSVWSPQSQSTLVFAQLLQLDKGL